MRYGALFLMVLVLLNACSETVEGTPRQLAEAPPAAAPSASGQVAAPPQRLLKTAPERGPVGATVTISGEGLPAGKDAEIIWMTVDGTYKTRESGGQTLGVEYVGRAFTERRLAVGRAVIGGKGDLSTAFPVPEDFGGLHDIYLSVEGQDVAKGGFRLMRSFAMTPVAGPVGTLITVKAAGLGWTPFESTAALRYDNKYAGFISATTTHGTAVAQVRAAGPVGKHYISVDPGSHAQPFLNITTGGLDTRHLLPFEAVFTVTGDDGPPGPTVDWPDGARVAAVDRMSRIPAMGEMRATPGVSVRLAPVSGPVLTRVTVSGTGLPAGPVDLVWVATRRTDPLLGSGAGGDVRRLATVAAGPGGAIDAGIVVPEDIGGWHLLQVVVGGKVWAEAPFYVEQSLVTPVPMRVKAGEKFTISFKGGGWTEMDNGAAVTYDNAYTGYACGYANGGETPIELTATGGPGTHLIDIYPYIFDGGHGDWPWQYNLPQLTALQDHPGLDLGYRLPIYRLAIEVIP